MNEGRYSKERKEEMKGKKVGVLRHYVQEMLQLWFPGSVVKAD